MVANPCYNTKIQNFWNVYVDTNNVIFRKRLLNVKIEFLKISCTNNFALFAFLICSSNPIYFFNCHNYEYFL